MEKIISEKEFQESLLIVNSYITQLNNKIIGVENSKKTSILDWIKLKKLNLPKITNQHTRLFSVLENIYYSKYSDKEEFIENLKNTDFNKYRNSGKITQKIFNDLYYEIPQ